MDNKRLVKVSKFLSKYLRHEPEALGLVLEPGGWVTVDDLLAAAAARHFPITRAELDEVVATNDKKRFAFDYAGGRVRANQGHSAEVDLQLEPAAPPAVLFHGTPEMFVDSIRATGLDKRDRHHVHLSPDEATATKVGARRGKPVILRIDAAAMAAAGFVFFCSANNVWLVDHVPPRYIQIL